MSGSTIEDEEQCDLMLAQMAAKMGGVQPLLKSVFGFLHRRTDFYVEYDAAASPKASMGFPKGVPHKIVHDAFLQFPFKKYEDIEASAHPPPAPTPATLGDTKEAMQAASAEPAAAAAAAGGGGGVRSLSMNSLRLVDGTDKQVPIGNGGIGPNYYWTQTLQDATVYVDVPEGTRGKDIRCEIRAKSMVLAAHGAVLLEGEFEDPVRVDESMWTINISSSGTQPPQVVVTLDKTRKTWWKYALVGHPEIDTSKVDSTQKIGEYDEATQAAIRKIMFEQQQKRLMENGSNTTADLEDN